MLHQQTASGILELPLYVREILRNPAIKRLRQVSHSATSFLFPLGEERCQSKLKHSMEVLALAQVVGERKEFRPIERELRLAALLHDIATPPLSHLAEEHMGEVLGLDHEAAAAEVIRTSGLADIIRGCECDPRDVIALIRGKNKPYSCLLHGYCDIDSIAGMKGYMESQGLPWPKEAHYDPATLARGLCLRECQICIHESAWEEYKRWRRFRAHMYAMAIFNERQLSAWAMISRAIGLAREERMLHANFFRMTDMEAVSSLQKCPPARKLLSALRDSELYTRLEYQSAATREQADALADALADMVKGLPDWQYAISIREDTGPKPMMPCWSERHGVVYADLERRKGQRHNRHIVQLFVHPRHINKVSRAGAIF